MLKNPLFSTGVFKKEPYGWLLKVIITVIKCHSPKKFGQGAYLSYTTTSLFITKGIQTGQELEAGAIAEAMDGYCLLACSP